MIRTSIIVLLLGVFLLPFVYTPSSYAQDTDCDAELLADTEAHDVAMYLFTEIEKPSFDRQQFVIAFIVYSNKLTIEDGVCGLGVQAKLLSWAFEVYRTKANHYFKLLSDEDYEKVQVSLFEQRAKLYTMYCEAFPITCVDGVPMSYDELLKTLEPASTNDPL